MITQKELKQLLQYDPISGEFTSLKTGYTYRGLDRNGYKRIKVNGKFCFSHRLAWLYIHGKWPVDQIDHINGIHGDNRLCNLRECNNRENNQNRDKHKDNTSGHKGVVWLKKNKKWKAQIMKDRKQNYLGSFERKEDAINAYRIACERLHGEFARL